MRVLLISIPLLAAADGAAAHALDSAHTLAEQLAHQAMAPHHVLMLIGVWAGLLVLYRWNSMRRSRID